MRKPGEKRVFVRASLAGVYIHLLNTVALDYTDDDSEFEASIQCIVWGGLVVESLVNRMCEEAVEVVLMNGRQDKHQAVWALVERSPLERKLGFVLDVVGVERGEAKAELQKVRGLVQMRNRLFHFKDSPTEVDGSILEQPGLPGETLFDVFERLDDPRVFRDVLARPPAHYRDDVRSVVSWLDDLRMTLNGGQPLDEG